MALDISATPTSRSNDRIVGAQAGILTTSLCTLVLAALFAERRQQEAALSEGAARLEKALAAGAVIAFEWDARTGLSHRSENAANILGYDPQAPLYGSSLSCADSPG